VTPVFEVSALADSNHYSRGWLLISAARTCESNRWSRISARCLAPGAVVHASLTLASRVGSLTTSAEDPSL
jgi:hypothetical protein